MNRNMRNALLGSLILWLLASIAASQMQFQALPGPFDTLQTLIRDLPQISAHLLASLMRVSIAASTSLGIGAALGYVTGMSRLFDRRLTPILHLVYPIPRIAFLPIVFTLFGLGELSKIVLVIAVSCFYVIFPIRNQVQNIPGQLNLQAQILRWTRWERFRHLVFPASLPALFTASKLVVGVSFAALFFAELYGTQRGIAYYIMNAWFVSDYKAMYAGILTLSLSGILIFELLEWLERRLTPWVDR